MNIACSTDRISVIISAHNSELYLDECLNALECSASRVHEIIVVDDGSTDRTLSVAQEHRVKTISLDNVYGTNYCRNTGAKTASGDVLLFIDSDVVVQADTIKRISDCLKDTTVDAVVGVYTVKHRHPGLTSQYKNLWIRFSYLKSGPTIDWIFGAVAAIRREVVQKAGGFDSTIFMKFGGEDLELGKRMVRSHHRIVCDPSAEVEHLKRHTLRSLLRNDYQRSQGFIRLACDLGQVGSAISDGFANIYPSFILSTIFSWPIALSGAVGLWFPSFWWTFSILGATYIGLNTPFYRYFAKHRGRFEAFKVVGLMFLDHLVCTLGSLRGVLRWRVSRQ